MSLEESAMASPILDDLQRLMSDILALIVRCLQGIPGSKIVIAYIKSSYQNDPIRSFVEFLLFLFALRYVLAPRQSSQPGSVVFTERELEELVREWQPEPLIEDPTPEERDMIARQPTIMGRPGPHSCLANGKNVVNLASLNFLNLSNNPQIIAAALETTRLYGVGACGPPGFYGSEDIHLRLEDDIRDFLGTEQAILYAQAFQTIQSAIPAFAKRGDVLIVDRGVNFAIEKGIQISRSNVRWFEHNNIADLERICQEVAREQQLRKKTITRRFIITEALFEKTGEIADLPKIVEIKKNYKFRLILDESLSIGALGRTGRGATEYFNVPVSDIDMIVGSLSGAFAGAGGFCAGSVDVVEHQRTSASSYVFSASITAPQAVIGSESIRLLSQDMPYPPLESLRENITAFLMVINKSSNVRCISSPVSPLICLRLSPVIIEDCAIGSWEQQETVLMDIVDEACNQGVMINFSKSIPQQTMLDIIPTLRICISAALSKKETSKAASVLKSAISKIIKNLRKISYVTQTI